MTSGSWRKLAQRRCRVVAGISLLAILIGAGPLLADPVTDYNVAVEFYRRQRWAEAAEACREFLQRHPDHEQAASASLYLAQALLHQREFQAARDQFRRFLSRAGDHADRPLAMYRLGECSYFLGDYAAASDDLERFLQQHPQHELAEWALVYLGEAQFRRNEYPGAIRSFEEARRRFPQGRLADDAEYGLARSLDGAGRAAEAQAAYQRIASRSDSPRAADALFRLASRHFEQGDYRQAADAFSRVKTPQASLTLEAMAQLNAGYAEYHLGQFDAAIAHFENAAADERQAPAARYWIGLARKSTGEYRLAAETFAQALESDPDQPLGMNLTFHWGDAELRQENSDRAEELFLRVVERWPDGDLADDALHLAGQAALQSGNLDAARRLHERFLATFPASGQRQVQDLLFARILIAEGDAAGDENIARERFREAVTTLDRVVDSTMLPETRNAARFQLVRAFERLKEDQPAIRELTRLIEADPPLPRSDRAAALLQRGNARLRLGERRVALDDYRQSAREAETAGDKTRAYGGLSQALTELEDWASLRTALEELRAIDDADRQFGRSAVAAAEAAFAAGNRAAADGLYRLVAEDAGQADSPHYRAAVSGLAHNEYEREEYASAANWFGKLRDATADDRELQSHAAYMAALSLRQAGDREQALKLFQQAVEMFSLSAEGEESAAELPVGLNAYRSAKGGARVARELGENAAAEALYEAAYRELKRQPQDAQEDLDKLLNEWADLSYNAENYPRADELYTLLIAECPASPLAAHARLVLGESLRFGEKLDEARAAFEKLAEDDTADAFVRQRSLVHLLDLAAESADWEAALDVSRRLAEFPESPHRAYAEFRRGEAQIQLKQYAAAVRTLQDLQRQLSGDLAGAPEWWPEVWLQLAEAQYGSKNYADVEATLADFEARQPESPLSWRAALIRGRSYQSQAKFEEAREALQQVVDGAASRGTESAAEAQFRIADTYLLQKNHTAALREYLKVYVGYGSSSYQDAALYQAAACDATLKNYEDAAQTYRRLIEEFPDSDFANRARVRLKELPVVSPPASADPS